MPDIVLKANRKTPGVATIGNDLESHTRALQAIAEAIAIHERRTKNLLSSFVRVEELIDLGLLDLTGDTLTLSDDLGGSGAVDSVNGQTGTVSLGLEDLDDVDLDGLLDGDTLIYDATYGLFVPGSPASSSGAVTKLDSITVGSATPTVTFSSISSAYSHLRVIYSVNGSTQFGVMYMQYNGDTGANYDTAQQFGGSSGGNTVSLNAATPEIASMPGSAYSANQRQTGEILIPFYSDATAYKTATTHNGRRDASALYDESYIHNWHNTNAISSILLGLASGNFVVGSRFDLYGIQ
jgi:hypothetical protein